ADAAEISRLLEQLGCDVNTQTVRGRLDVHDGVHGAGVVVATDDGGVVGVVASSPAIPRLPKVAASFESRRSPWQTPTVAAVSGGVSSKRSRNGRGRWGRRFWK
ncbi:MAG: hypothetical protein P8Y95_08905, partial [Gammaproteobacteria bacterium]